MAGCSVNKSVPWLELGATIAFFIGASIALETRSAGAGAGGAYCSTTLTPQIVREITNGIHGIVC